jgi:hypothetical protein
VNLYFVLPESLLECAPRIWRVSRRRDNELRQSSDQALDLPEIFGLIRRDPKRAGCSERTTNCGEKIFGDHATTRMSPLWPRIGKHQMKHFHRSRGKQVRDGITEFDAQDPGVRQIGLQNFPAGAANATLKPLDPQEISIEILPGASRKIGAITAAEIHFDQSRPRKNFRERNGMKIVRWDEFNRVGELRNSAVSPHPIR